MSIERQTPWVEGQLEDGTSFWELVLSLETLRVYQIGPDKFAESSLDFLEPDDEIWTDLKTAQDEILQDFTKQVQNTIDVFQTLYLEILRISNPVSTQNLDG